METENHSIDNDNPTETTLYRHKTEAKEAMDVGKLFKEDANWKIKSRKWYAPIFLGFLFLQNFATYTFIYILYNQGRLEELQLFAASIFVGLIAETAYIVKIIIKWLFTDIDYSKHPLNKDR